MAIQGFLGLIEINGLLLPIAMMNLPKYVAHPERVSINPSFGSPAISSKLN